MRYITAKAEEEAVSAKHLLYGEEMVRGHAVVVVEGPADVWAIGPGAVATLGVVVSRQQLEKIAAYPVRVLCLDADELPAVSTAEALALAVLKGDTVAALMLADKVMEENR